MALVIQAYTFAQQYVNSWFHPTPTKSSMGLKLGVISSAQINPAASCVGTPAIISFPYLFPLIK
jgi:hypothetical protein